MKNFNQYITEKIKLSSDRFNKKINLEYVDLELPSETLWAACNVGAENPWDYGDYFAWGETEPKKEYNWDTYKFGTRDNLTKYLYDDRLFELEFEDDAARVNMGDKWHMPMKEQIRELYDETNHQYVKNYNNTGVNGILFTGKNGNELFIPAGGRIEDNKKETETHNCYIWSSTHYWAKSEPYDTARHFAAYTSGCSFGDYNRCLGLNVRGVLNK
jgi:hypothetical protein